MFRADLMSVESSAKITLDLSHSLETMATLRCIKVTEEREAASSFTSGTYRLTTTGTVCLCWAIPVIFATPRCWLVAHIQKAAQSAAVQTIHDWIGLFGEAAEAAAERAGDGRIYNSQGLSDGSDFTVA